MASTKKPTRERRERKVRTTEPSVVVAARRALAALHAVAAERTVDDARRAVEVAGAAIDFLAGDEVAAPHALTRVRRMHNALVATTLDTIAHEVRAGAENVRACSPKNRLAMVNLFLRRIGPHLVALGVEPHRVPRAEVATILARWRARPKHRLRELTTTGVVVALLVAVEVPEKNARERVRRHTSM